MADTRTLQVTLPLDLVELVSGLVVSGEYESASEVVRAGLLGLRANEQDLEAWLVRDVVPTYDALMAGKVATLSGEEVRARQAARLRAATRDP